MTVPEERHAIPLQTARSAAVDFVLALSHITTITFKA